MTRRITLSFVLATLLIVPALALALPSPETLGMSRDSDPTKTSRDQVGAALTIPATGAIVNTPTLTEGRLYEFDVSGTWQYSANSSHKADMAYSTTDNWSSASKGQGARSLMIETQKQSDTTVGYRPLHDYKGIAYSGRGTSIALKIFDENYGDNTGSLTVTVWQVNKVTWTFSNVQPLPEQLEVGGSGTSVPPTPIPATTVPPFTVGGGTSLTVARVEAYNSTFLNGQPSYCLRITVVGAASELGCVADPLRRGVPLDLPVTVPAPPQVTVCDPNQTPPCVLPGVSPTPVGFGGGGIKKGSSLVLSLSWTGDTSKLWNYGTINGTSITQRSNGWAPFDPTKDTAWFAANASSLGVTVSGCIKNPAPENTCSQTQSFTVPALGQFLQAMFQTQVNGQ